MKLERIRKFCLDLIPKAPDAKILVFGADIVYQNYSAVLNLRQPGVEVVPDSFVSVESIDVQKINRIFGKLRESIVEALPQQV